MKSLVIYYSRTNNTDMVAKELARLISGDIIRVEEERPRQDGIGNVITFFQLLFGSKTKLKPVTLTTEGYDAIYLGTPVWYKKPSLPIQTVISELDFSGKKVYLFGTSRQGADPAFSVMKRQIAAKGGKVIDTMGVRTNKSGKMVFRTVKEHLLNWINKVR